MRWSFDASVLAATQRAYLAKTHEPTYLRRTLTEPRPLPHTGYQRVGDQLRSETDWVGFFKTKT